MKENDRKKHEVDERERKKSEGKGIKNKEK